VPVADPDPVCDDVLEADAVFVGVPVAIPVTVEEKEAVPEIV